MKNRITINLKTPRSYMLTGGPLDGSESTLNFIPKGYRVVQGMREAIWMGPPPHTR